MSQTSMPTPTVTASARPAGVTGRRVAGRRLQLRERLPPLGDEIALVNRVVDEVPRQAGVEGIHAVHEPVRIDEIAGVAAERGEDRPPVVGALRQPRENVPRTAIAAREER